MDNRSSVRTIGLVAGTVVLLIVLFFVAGISTGFLPWRDSYADSTRTSEQLDALEPAPTAPPQNEVEKDIITDVEIDETWAPEIEPLPDGTLAEEFPTYTITVTYSRGGTAIPYGNNSVVEKGQMIVTAVPDEGYMVDEMIVDGERFKNMDTYVFDNVMSNHTVYISFKRSGFVPDLLPPVYAEEGEAPLPNE